MRNQAGSINRRRWLGGAVAFCAAYGVAGAGQAVTAPRLLRLRHLHTDEQLETVYFRDGAYLGNALRQLDWFFRDWRVDSAVPLDPRCLDILFGLTRRFGFDTPFEIISGYRSRATNDMLRRRSEGVAPNSLHIYGRAIDFRLPGVPLAELRDAAVALGQGGVGYYRSSQFVHIDTGVVRAW